MQIELRYRHYDFDDWTQTTLEGELAEASASVLTAWALNREFEVEILEEDGEWVCALEERGTEE